jgi:CMP-2-keto-3-deoxyoctulosonic acid synthetase
MVTTSPATQIEMAESIEQMKIIEMGLNVLGVMVGTNYPSVNTKHDVLAVLEILESSKEQQAILRLIQ